MIKAFKERRWWAAALVNLFLDPFLGMLYMGRAGLAFGYLVALVGYISLTFFYLFPTLAPAHNNLTVELISLPVRLIGAVHGAIIAKHVPAGIALPRYSRWYSLLATFLLFLLAALFVRTFFYQPFDAPSASMEPNINVGDYFFVSKRAFDRAGIQRGDIVVFHGTEGDYVKRIIGLPGDRVHMRNGQLVLNGAPVSRRRVEDFRGVDRYGVSRLIRQDVEALPTGRSYRTLDLENNSNEDNTVIFVVPADHYFVLGDNRDNSDDSRISQGYIARKNILGKVVVKFADRQHKTMIWEPVN